VKRVAFTLAAAVTLAVSGCSDKTPPVDLNEETTAPEPGPAAAPEPAPPPVVEATKPPPPPVVERDEPVPDEPVDESAQTQDDADAVGMTTRAPPPLDGDESPALDGAASGSQSHSDQ
jgi:hypothetical protein